MVGRGGSAELPRCPPPVDLRRLGDLMATGVRLWKLKLGRLATEPGLAITVAHFPPGTSKWNRLHGEWNYTIGGRRPPSARKRRPCSVMAHNLARWVSRLGRERHRHRTLSPALPAHTAAHYPLSPQADLAPVRALALRGSASRNR